MSIPKVTGIEQEYAIKVSGMPDLDPFTASCALVNAHAEKAGLRRKGMKTIWDYGHETPFQDIRGDIFGKSTGQEIMSIKDNRLINAALPNGARLYTDHAHPEYSTPECLTTLEAVACDKAGEKILQDAIRIAEDALHPAKITLFKNNTDHQGHSYGCHENYLMDASAHQEFLVESQQKALATLIPFLVTRQIYSGSGKAGSERTGKGNTGYQISQRAEFMEKLFGLETMYSRPLVNTRSEHHADPKRFRRLHLIMGDANMSEFATFLKLGATRLVLRMFEDDFIDGNLALKDPVKAVRAISADFNARVELENGNVATALELQRRFFDHAVRYDEKREDNEDSETETVLAYWDETLDGLSRLKISSDMDIQDDPAGLSARLDWVLKLWLLNRVRLGKNLSWRDSQLKVLDLKYHNIDENEGVFYNLQKKGLAQKLLEESAVERFVNNPPESTRAWFRGKCIEKFPDEVYLVNWEVVGFDKGDVYRMIPLLNPFKGAGNRFREVFNGCRNAGELIDAVQG